MVKRKQPDVGQENPHLIRSLYRAMEHAVIPSETVFDRMASLGNAYHVGSRFTITQTQGSAYFYIDNSSVSDPFLLQTDVIKVSGGDALTYVWDEPDVDETTFTSIEYKNLRSDVTSGPESDAYFGYDNNVTINDTGLLYEEDFIKASSGSPGTTSTGAGSNGEAKYIIGDGSTAMLQIENDSQNDIEVSVSSFFYYVPDVPVIIDGNNTQP